jgi:hypothetical protein
MSYKSQELAKLAEVSYTITTRSDPQSSVCIFLASILKGSLSKTESVTDTGVLVSIHLYCIYNVDSNKSYKAQKLGTCITILSP